MSFDEAERSNYHGVPIKLYEFSLGANYWRYCTSETAVVQDGNTFLPLPISDGGTVESGDVQNDDFTVTLPASATFAALFVATPPSQEVYVTVREKNYGEPDAPIVGVYLVRSTKLVDQVTYEVLCKTLTASLNRNGLRLSFSRGCPHALYDSNCRADPAAFAISLPVQSMTGASITSAALGTIASGYLSGGFFEFQLLPGVMERRAIEEHTGSSFNILGTTDGLSVGDWINVYPGCDRITTTCANKFNNLVNYGGFPHLPGKSPFDGDPVF